MPRAGHIQNEITGIQAVGTPIQVNQTFTAAGSNDILTPASGKKIRIKAIIIESSADADIGLRFTATGTIYYLRTTKGPWALNLVGCNIEGSADQHLYLYASGACTVKGTIMTQEV